MTPGVGRRTADEQSLERQMGCMAGFLQLFDRHQILVGKRLYPAKRFPISPAAGSTSPSERSEASVASSFVKESLPCPSPEACPSSPESRAAPARPSLPLPVVDGVKASWKLREAPRLSLDSRAIVDGKGKLRPREIRTSRNQSEASESGDDLDKQRRSPSVVARLMGLEALPGDGGDPAKPAELRRSASESRASRDLSHYRFVDTNAFQKPPLRDAAFSGETFRYRTPDFGIRDSKPSHPPARAPFAASQLQRKSFFDAEDFFPEPKRTGSLYGEIERRLRMRGIDEPAKDLETLKQILEALQLKGLLHSKFPSGNQMDSPRRSNLAYDHHVARISPNDSPIVVMKPASKPPRRPASEPPLPSRMARRSPAPQASPPARTRRDRVEMERNPRGRSPRSPDRPELTRSPISPASRRQANVSAPPPQRRSPTPHSPKASPKRAGPDSPAIRSPRNRRATREASPKERIYSPSVEDDSSTTVSESSISSSSQFDFEKSRVEEYRAGRSLLERCDKLLHSIAAITSSPAEEQQPSPVSVLDASSFLCGDESSSPSPATKRSIDFKDPLAEWEEDYHWIPGPPSVQSQHVDGPGGAADGGDLAYVSEILRAWGRQRDLAGVYAALELRHGKSGGTAASRLHRRLVFDAVAEILDRKRNQPPWEAFRRQSAAASGGAALVREVWAEVRRARERVLPAAEDLNDATCGAIREDMAAGGDGGWGGACAGEISDAVLHIERQIYKDLVAETIQDLAGLAGGRARSALPRRRLVFDGAEKKRINQS